MGEIRISALAKQLNVDSQEILNAINRLGIEGKGSPLAGLTVEEVELIKHWLDDPDIQRWQEKWQRYQAFCRTIKEQRKRMEEEQKKEDERIGIEDEKQRYEEWLKHIEEGQQREYAAWLKNGEYDEEWLKSEECQKAQYDIWKQYKEWKRHKEVAAQKAAEWNASKCCGQAVSRINMDHPKQTSGQPLKTLCLIKSFALILVETMTFCPN